MADVDERLRSYAARWRQQENAPDVDTEISQASGRSHRLLTLAAAAVVVSMVTAAVLWSRDDGGQRVEVSSRSSGADGAVPWVDERAEAASRPVIDSSAPACQADALTAGTSEHGVASGSSVWSVPLSNRSAAACSVPVIPVVTGLDANGSRVKLSDDKLDSSSVAVGAREHARVIFQTGSSCDGAGAAPPTSKYRSLEMVINGEALPLPGVEPALCEGERLIGKTTPGAPPPPEPGTFGSLTALVEDVGTVRPGRELRYIVVLTNPTDAAVRFSGNCPVYTQIMSTGADTVITSYRLNCRPVTEIAPRAEVRFAMVIQAPSTPGMAKLGWSLTPDGPSAGTPANVGP